MYSSRASLLLPFLIYCCFAALVYADTLNVTCSQRPVDTQYSPVNVTCSFILLAPAGANAYQVFAKNGDYTVNPINGYLYYDTPNITRVNTTLTFMLERYAPNGTYNIEAHAIGYYTGVRLFIRTTFIVSTTVNDNLPPTLTSIYAPVVNISNPSAAYIQITAKDDLSRFDTIQVDISVIKGGYPGFGNAQYILGVTPIIQNGTSLSVTLRLNIYEGQLISGIYYMQVTLCDRFRHCVVITSDELQQRKLQFELNVGAVSIRDNISLVCPQTSYDVQNRSFKVPCELRLQFASGIYWYQVYTAQQGGDMLRLAGPEDYYSTNQSITSLVLDAGILLKQYQPDGTYQVSVQAGGYNGAYLKAEATITVAKTINDQIAPLVNYVYMPNVNSSVSTIPVILNLTDDYGGVDSLYVRIEIQNCPGECRAPAEVYWNAPANSTNLKINLHLLLEVRGVLQPGIYYLSVIVTDVFGRTRRYYRDELAGSMLQDSIIVTPGTFLPGSEPKLDRFYVPPVVKDRTELYVRLSASAPDGLNTISVIAYRSNFTIGSNMWSANPNFTQFSMEDIVLNIQIPSGTPAGLYFIDVIISNIYGQVSKYTYANLTRNGFKGNFTYAKSPCAAGRYRLYSAASNQSCSLCPIGTYSEAGEYHCQQCPPGFFSTVNGSALCQQCPAGTTGIGGSWACSPCSTGFYNGQNGQVACIPCPAGSVNYGVGNAVCYQCPSGTYTVRGKEDCFACPAGTYSTAASDYCTACPPGTFSNTPGVSECTPCAAGSFASGGFTICTPCEGGKKSPKGSSSKLNCYSD